LEPAVANSNVVYSAGPYSDALGLLKMSLDLGATPLTPTVVTGSFAGSLVQNTITRITTNAGHCAVGPAFVFPRGSMKF